MTIVSKLRGLLVASVLALGSFAAQAAPIIWIDDVNGVLGRVDVATNAVTVVGNTGQILTDIAFSPTQDLYGITFTGLYSINQLTAVATFVGNLGPTDVNGLVFGA